MIKGTVKCSRTIAAVAFLMILIGRTGESVADSALAINDDVLASVQSLYGLTADQAIMRLAREESAAEKYELIKNLGLVEYAGSWFDEGTLDLQVAISDLVQRPMVERLGATAVPVAYNLAALKAAESNAVAALINDEDTKDFIRSTRIDFKANQVIIGIDASRIDNARAILSARGMGNAPVILTEDRGNLTFAAAVRGADGFYNAGTTKYCSIGASIVGGFVTAGHCGKKNQVLTTSPGGSTLGTVIGSTWLGFNTYEHNEDGAWVSTTSGWTPKPQVNGYTDGTIYINRKWSGIQSVPVGSTVCLYGQTSGGPDCGTVTAKGVFFYVGGTGKVSGVTEACYITMQAGDSGGPYLSGVDQMQGTNSASAASSATCSSNAAYYQPIITTLKRFTRIMLTPHGAQKPSINNYVCPHSGNSGDGQYWCQIGSYNSQGDTSMSWSTNLGNSSTFTYVAGTCSTGQTVNVDLAVTNPYGTLYKSASFSCPTGPI